MVGEATVRGRSPRQAIARALNESCKAPRNILADMRCVCKKKQIKYACTLDNSRYRLGSLPLALLSTRSGVVDFTEEALFGLHKYAMHTSIAL